MAYYNRNRQQNSDRYEGTSVKFVQCEGLAAMKIVKHCHEESLGNMEVAQGALLGLVMDNHLEITNCFPFPKNDETMDDEEYQISMMRQLRKVNVDHFHVGWYQSAEVGNFLSLPLLESQYYYQTSIEESVVVIYDTAKSSRGFLTLKAYRLTPQALALYKEREFTPEALRNLKIGFESLFTEIPIVVKNSALTNIMLTELGEMVPEEEGAHFLDLGTAGVLENHLRCLMDRVDELNQEATKFNKYQQQVVRQEQEKHRALAKLAQENSIRLSKGESALPEEDVNKQFRPPAVPPRLTPMIVSGQINTYCQHISQFCSCSLAKLYMTQSLQTAKENKQ